MKILVTGGAGFIGSNFIHYWLAEHPDDAIVNFDALTYAGNPANVADRSTYPNYSFIHGDICDSEAVQSVVDGIDTIVHFAAETHVDRSILDPAVFVRTNVLGTHTLLEAARQNGNIRFHHTSTDEVFGTLELSKETAFSEDTSYDPRSPYSASKAGADHLVRSYFHTFGLPVTISNCSNNYGPYLHPEKLFSLAITNLLEGKKIPIYGNGKQVRDWLFVTDHARAIDRILQDGKIGETYVVGGMKKDVSNIEALRMILQIMGKDDSQLEFVKDRPGHDVRYAVDWSKVNRELDWEPSVELYEGLEKTVQWYTEHQDWWKAIRNTDFDAYYAKQYSK